MINFQDEQAISEIILPLYALFFDALPEQLGISIQVNAELPDLSPYFESYYSDKGYTSFSRMKEKVILEQIEMMRLNFHPLNPLYEAYVKPDITGNIASFTEDDSETEIQTKLQNNNEFITKYFFEATRRGDIIKCDKDSIINRKLMSFKSFENPVYLHIPPININNLDILISLFCGADTGIQFAFSNDNIICIYII